ncbi:specific transcriptional repressor [Coprinopsis cinerea AmutBmut pab1-1]|nr:specific transcriptional repressor [Coprinopsis cinerea AmutBmut pab1-1]
MVHYTQFSLNVFANDARYHPYYTGYEARLSPPPPPLLTIENTSYSNANTALTTTKADHDRVASKSQSPGAVDNSSLSPSVPKTRSGRVPRPRNAFMIFRSAFWAEAKITRDVEHDHRHISRIIGHCWNKMSEEEKNVWRRKADEEKIEHEKKYPGYRFCPIQRTKKPIKRKVKRNGEEDLIRCERLADLLLAGKQGDELSDAIKEMPPVTKSTKSASNPDEPPFRSPLLPPLSFDHDRSSACSSSESSPRTPYFSASAPSLSLELTQHPLDLNYSRRSLSESTKTEHIVFEAPNFPTASYSLYQSQASACALMRSNDLHVESLHSSGHCASYPSTYPRSVVSFYNPFSLCDPEANSAPVLPSPLSSASIMSEPVQWNTAYPFTT